MQDSPLLSGPPGSVLWKLCVSFRQRPHLQGAGRSKDKGLQPQRPLGLTHGAQESRSPREADAASGFLSGAGIKRRPQLVALQAGKSGPGNRLSAASSDSECVQTQGVWPASCVCAVVMGDRAHLASKGKVSLPRTVPPPRPGQGSPPGVCTAAGTGDLQIRGGLLVTMAPFSGPHTQHS